MSDESAVQHNRWLVPIVAVVGIAALCAAPMPGGALGPRFFASLRIAKPKPIAATAPAAGTSGNRQLQQLVAGLLTDTTVVSLDEPDFAVPSADSARRAAEFAPRLFAGRTDPPSFSVIGSHADQIRVIAEQLQTNLRQAGRPTLAQPASVEGATVTLTTHRAVRVQYGNCPAPIANTLQNQLQGPPPPTTDNGNCVVLMETPQTTVIFPPPLDAEQLVGIALELAGMSPKQGGDFQRLFDASKALSMSLPRNLRSYDTLHVAGVPAMLVNSGGRRGPTYALLWAADGIVYTLTGYGSSADGIALARMAR